MISRKKPGRGDAAAVADDNDDDGNAGDFANRGEAADNADGKAAAADVSSRSRKTKHSKTRGGSRSEQSLDSIFSHIRSCSSALS